MPRLRAPDGRIVSVSRRGREALLARGGYTDADRGAEQAALAPAAPEREEQPERPAVSAPKAEWVAYAEARGVEGADGLTKAELIDLLVEEE